jgi:monovalent cation/proton antiporter MnhG/PhaG subunit
MAWFFILTGMVIMFFGVLGMIILPDFLLRIHASTKCGVTGAVNILIGFMIMSGGMEFILKLLLIVLFLFITSPLIAHVLALYHYRSKNIENKGNQDA